MVMDANVPREIRDSISYVLGEDRKARTVRMVQAGIKPDRMDTRTLVLTDFRLLIFTTKVPVKIEHNIHFLEITGIESPASNQVCIGKDDRRVYLTTMDRGEVDDLILQIGQSLHKAFPAKKLQSLVPRFVVEDTPRQLSLLDRLHDVTAGASGDGEVACGSFSMAYRCVCDLQNAPWQEDVVWDVDTIYLSQDQRTLNLADFDHLEGKHLVPIISALEHNAWFTGLNVDNIKLSPEAFTEVLRVVKSNTALEELHLANIGAKADFAQRLTSVLSANEGAPLKVLDLSNNLLEDKGLSSLCQVPRVSKGLTALTLRGVGMTGKGINKIGEALANNPYIPTTLTTLDLTANPAKGEDLTMLNKFLSTPNALTHLTLSGTDCALDTMCAAWLRGCTTHLQHLDVSGCTFSLKKTKDITVPNSWKQFFSSSLALETVSLADCKGLPTDAIKSLLLGLSSNPQPLSVSVNLSGCSLGQPGAAMLEICVPALQNISSLDVSNNSLDQGLEGLMSKMGMNRCIRKLNIGRNFTGIKARNLPQVLGAVVLLIQDELTTVESLSLADSKLKSEITNLINALGANSSLHEIDISGNQMGDIGARMLAKALQLNTKLHSIHWDNNNTSPQGFHDIAAALQTNYTVKQMPTPINDATNAYKLNQEKTQAAIQTIEKLLQRNHSPRKFSSEQAFRLQQGFLLSSSQQMVDKLMFQINSLLSTSTTLPPGDAGAARQLLQDAERSRNILPAFQKLTATADTTAPLTPALQESSQRLHAVIQQCMQKNMSSMVECADTQCPTVMKDKTFHTDLMAACEEKSCVPANFTEALLMEQVGTDIANKISEVNLSVAAYMSDKITDGVLESLDKSYKHLSKLKGESGLDRDARHSILRTKSNESLEESPKLSKKKKSLYSRRLRPQSTINAQDVQEAAQKLRLRELDSIPDSPPPQHSGNKPPPLMSQSPRSFRRTAPPVPAPPVPTPPAEAVKSDDKGVDANVKLQKRLEPLVSKGESSTITQTMSSSIATTSSSTVASATTAAAAGQSAQSSAGQSSSGGQRSSPKKTAPPPPIPSSISPVPVAAPRKKRASQQFDSPATTPSQDSGDSSKSSKNRDTSSWVVVTRKDKKKEGDMADIEEGEGGGGGGNKDGDVAADIDDDNRSEDSLDTTDLTDLTDASTVDTLDSRESTPSSEVSSRPVVSRSAPHTPQGSAAAELDDVLASSLTDTTSAPRLQHLGKNRPKRAKTRAASRAIVSHSDIIKGGEENNVDEFFENKIPPSLSASSLSAATGGKDVINGAEPVEQESKKKSSKSVLDKPTTFAANLSNLFRRKPPSPMSPEPPQLKTPDDGPTRRSPDGENSAIAEERESSPSTGEEEKEEERPSPSGFRRPPGAVPMGGPMMGGPMGGGLMSELKKKQRQSVMPSMSSTDGGEKSERTIPPSSSSSAPSSGSGHITHKVVPAYGSQRPPSLAPRGTRDSVAVPENLAAPKPAVRRSVSPNDQASASGDKPNKPPPPLKPRPMVKPRPGARVAAPSSAAEQPPMMRKLTKPNPAPGNRTSDPDEQRTEADGAGSSGEDGKPSPSSSIKKRGSVRERARLLDNNNTDPAAPTAAPSRSKTLPRDTDSNGKNGVSVTG